MSTPKIAKVPTAISNTSELDLSCQHITTANFMEFNVAKAMELVPKQSIHINMRSFHRLEPMPVPTFGNADVHSRAYFVPFRTVMRGFNEMITDTNYVDGLGNSVSPSVPLISNEVLVEMFCQPLSMLSVVVDNPYDSVTNPDGNRYDFVYYPTSISSEIEYRQFTPYGKYVYKLLCSLGYKVIFGRTQGVVFHSALPFLCLLKIYADWYYPSAYVDSSRLEVIKLMLNFDIYSSDQFDTYFTADDYDIVFKEIWRVAYDSDYFVSAWDNPVAPSDGAFTSINFSDPTVANLAVVTDAEGTARVDASYNSKFTQFSIDSLKAVTDYMKRHQLAGARPITRYLSRFGIRLPDANLNRSTLIGELNTKVMFGDVTSTADTNSANLGSYAGKGIADQYGSIVDFSTDEFGYLIIIHTIVPKTAYYQGQDRNTMHISKFDFYTPEFDCLGVQALATRELYVPLGKQSENDVTYGADYDSVFGFVPRYAEYKRGYDNMTGDYVLGSKNVGKEGWTTMRNVEQYFKNSLGQIADYDKVHHDQNFVDGTDALQYNRIFYVTDNIEDKFNIVHNFVIKSRFPGKSLYDSYEFKDADKSSKVDIDINGVKEN